MECPVKDGILYIQHPKFGKKTWRKVWAQLFADSPSGVARLEYFEAREGGSGEKATLRKGERKVIRLSDCVSVERASEHSSPKDTTPFYLCMMERNCLLAADQSDEWVEHICQLAFQRTPASSSTVGNTPSPAPIMEENTIYSSWQETCEFSVTVYPTEASARCHLTGNYLMAPSPEHLLLKNAQSGQTIYSWPYVFLRRFGQKQNSFSFEAGRRCDSGEGLFTFNTSRAAEIYKVVSAAIDCQKTLLLRDKKPGISPSQGHLPKATGWSWPTNVVSHEDVQPFHPGLPKGAVETGLLSHSLSSEVEAPEPPIIYASIGQSFLPLGDMEPEAQQQSEELPDHLYENFQARLSCKDSPEESGKEASPIYDNNPGLTKHVSSNPSSTASSGTDTSLESLHTYQLLDCRGNESGGEGRGRPKTRGTGAFKHKLVTMLSRDGGANKPSSKNSCPVQK